MGAVTWETINVQSSRSDTKPSELLNALYSIMKYRNNILSKYIFVCVINVTFHTTAYSLHLN